MIELAQAVLELTGSNRSWCSSRCRKMTRNNASRHLKAREHLNWERSAARRIGKTIAYFDGLLSAGELIHGPCGF